MKNWDRQLLLVPLAFLVLLFGREARAYEPEELFKSGGVEMVLAMEEPVEFYIEEAQKAQGALWGYTNLGLCNVESGNLNVRTEPSTSSKLVGKMRRDDACEILEQIEEWSHILSGEVEGYVKTEFLLTGPMAKLHADDIIHTVAVAQTDGLNVREEAGENGKILTRVLKGEELDYVATDGDWVEIDLDGETAYVSAQYVEVETKLGTAITMTELLYGEGVSDIRVELVEYAKQFVGNPYVWGGTSLTKGADCSGFVLSVFKKFGVKLEHSSTSQANAGTKISAKELLPGDLVFYGNSLGRINHVAIYIGGGQVVHASSEKTGIKTNKYNYRSPVKCVRILQD